MKDDKLLDRGGSGAFLYSVAIGFLMFVPGTALLVFGGGKTLILPRSVIELIYPYTTPWPEKLLLTTITKKFDVFGKVTFADFAALNVFLQQFFILALLCSFLVLVVLMLQSRAGCLYPVPHELGIFRYLKITMVFFLLREMQVCLLVGEPDPVNSREPLRLLLGQIAPEFLILFSCTIAGNVWMMG